MIVNGSNQEISAPVRLRRAVLVADLAESVKLMLNDEASVIEHWRRFVHMVRNSILPTHDGRLIKSLGDGLLLMFGRATNAVSAALALHELIRDVSMTSGIPLKLRLGIHSTDLVADELDVYGSGVNLAARLAGAGQPGDTIVSTEVRDELVDGLQGRVIDLGELHLKHWHTTVRAFRIISSMSAPTGWAPDTFLDTRPGLAIMPLTTPPNTDAAWGNALADSMIVSLSANTAIRIVSLLSTQALSQTSLSHARARDMLGATYVIAGSVTASDSLLTIDLRLMTTENGSVIWGQHLEADVRSVFSAADGTIADLCRRISMQVVRREIGRARALPLANLADYTLYTGSVWMLHRLARQDFDRAHVLLEHLSERHPRSAAPQAMLSKWHLLRAIQGWAEDRVCASRQAQAFARRAVDLDPEHALALSMEAIVVAQIDGDLDEARRLGEAALAIDPQESHAWLNLGGIHSYLGGGAQAAAMPQRAIELSPLDPARFVFDCFLAEGRLTARDYQGAAEAAHASIRLNAMHPASHRVLTIALALAGRFDEARAAARDLLRHIPGFRIESYRRSYPGRDLPHMAERIEALRNSGIPT